MHYTNSIDLWIGGIFFSFVLVFGGIGWIAKSLTESDEDWKARLDADRIAEARRKRRRLD